MAIPYNAKDAVQVFAAGEYDAVLEKCSEETSKAGNPMFKLSWKVSCEDTGRTQQIFDYIVVPHMVWKIKKIAVAFGKLKEFEAETFQPEDHLNYSCRVTLKVDKQDGFDDKNAVTGYRAMENGSQAKSVPMTSALKAQIKRAESNQSEPVFAESKAVDDDCPF